MKTDKANNIQLEVKKAGLKYLGAIPFDIDVEAAIGDKVKLLKTSVGKKILHIIDSIILQREGKS